MPHSSSSSSVDSYDERDGVSIRSHNSGSGSSFTSVRHSQSGSDQDSVASGSGVSVHSVNTISSERDISPQRLQRTNSQNSSVSSSGSSVASERTNTGSSSSRSRESEIESQESEASVEESRLGERIEQLEIKQQEEEQRSTEIEEINAERRRNSGFDSPGNSICGTSSVCDDTVLQRRGIRKESSLRQRNGNSRSPVTFIISKSLASNFGDVLTKTSGLATALGRVVSMPVRGTVDGVESFGLYLKGKQRNENARDLNKFYTREWTPIIVAVAETFDAIQEEKEESDKFLSDLCFVLEESFKTIDADHSLIVNAVEAIERRMAKMERKNKRVTFEENGSRLQSDIVKLSSAFAKMEDNIEYKIEEIVERRLEDVAGSKEFKDRFKAMEKRIQELEMEVGIISDQMYRVSKNSEEFKERFKENFLSPVKDGIGDILRTTKFNANADMEKVQPVKVGQPERDTVIQNAPEDTHVEDVLIGGKVKINNFSDIQYPSESMPAVAYFDWTDTHAAGVVFAKYDLPDLLIKNNEYLKRDFSQFQYFTCDGVRIVITTTSNCFQGGHLGVSWDPFSTATSCGVVNSIPLSGLNNFAIPAGDSCVREIVIPFVCQQNLLSLAGKRQSSYSMGTLVFHPLNALKVPKDTDKSIPVTIYAQFLNPTFKVQTLIHDMYPEASASAAKVVSAMEVVSPIISDIIRLDEVVEPEIKEVEKMVIEPPLYLVPEIVMPITPIVVQEKFVPTLPVIAEKPVLEKLVQMEEKIQNISPQPAIRSVPSVGVQDSSSESEVEEENPVEEPVVSNPQIKEEKTVAEVPKPEPVVEPPVQEEKKVELDPKKYDANGVPYSVSNPYKRFPYYMSKWSPNPDAQLFQKWYWENKLKEYGDGRYMKIFPDAEGTFGGMDSVLNVGDFVDENIIHMGSWKSTDTGKLVSLTCSPTAVVRRDSESFYLPSLAHIGALFKHWRGSLIYKMTCGANSLSRGKLRLVALPEQKLFVDPDQSKMNYLPGAVYDLNSSQKSVEVVVPFNHTQNYQYTTMEYFCDANFHGEMILSRLHVYVVDKLMTNTGSNDTVNYYITVRPGADFEYCTPIGINMGYPSIPRAQISEAGEGIENPPTTVARDGQTKGFLITSETNPFNLERGYVLNDTLTHKECLTLNVGPVLQESSISDNPTAWVSSTHTRWRGSIDYEFMVSGHNANIAKTILIYYIPYGYETPNDIVKKPDYLPSSGLKFITWDLRQSSKCTVKVRWTSPLQSLFVAAEGYGKMFPDNKMFNGRLCLSLLGTTKEEVDIIGFVKAGEDFQLFDKSFLKTAGKGPKVDLLLPQYKIIQAVNETPKDKSEYVSSMPWPVENAYDPTKKLKPSTAEHAEMKIADYNTLEKNFKTNVKEARKKANATANMEVEPNMMSWVNPFLLGRENAAALEKLNLPKAVEGINNLVDSKGLCKMASLVDKVSTSDMDKISVFIQSLTPLLDESSKTLPKIMQQSSEGLEKASEGMGLLTSIGRKIMDWATTLIDLSLPGYIKSLHEHGEFVFALLATLVAIVMFVWWYRNTAGASFISRTLTLICLMWAPLLGKNLFDFSIWLFSTFKGVLEDTVLKMSEKFGWFQEKKEEVAREESIALQYVVSDMEAEGWIGKLFHDPSIIFTPILMMGAALIAFKAIGRPTKEHENKNFMQRCAILVKQFTGIATLAAFVVNLKSVAEKWGKLTLEWVHWMMGTELPEDAAVKLEVDFGVKQWMDDVLDCSKEETIHKLVADPDGVNKVRMLYERGKIINKALLEKSNLPHTFAIILRPLVEASKKLVDEAHKSKGSGEMRRDPFMIVMFGPPGQGKSATTELLVSDLLDMHKYPKEHRRYTRNPNDNHWNGYDRQPVVVYDDLGAVLQAGDSSDIAEIIGIKSNCPQSVKMADLEEKGKMFGSDFIIASTNITALDSNTDLRTHGAFYRRRDILVKVTRTGPRNPDNLAEGLAYQLYKMNPENKTLREDKVDDSGIVPVGKVMDYQMFLEFCYLKSKDHLDSQTRLVNFVKKMQEQWKSAPDVFQLEKKFREFFGDEGVPEAKDMFVKEEEGHQNEIKFELMSSVECNSEDYIYNDITLQEEYDKRGYSGKSMSAILDDLPYYEELLENCPSHKFEDHLRCLCVCDTSKQFRNHECAANEFCDRLLRFNVFSKKKKRCNFINGNYSGDVALKDMTQLELLHTLIYLKYLTTPRSDSVCVVAEKLKTFIKPKILESCLEYRAEKFDFPIGSSLIQHDRGFKILMWDGVADMYPHLMLQYGGVWLMDHEEIYLITDHIRAEYPLDLKDCLHKSLKFLIERGCLLGMREILQHTPEDDIVIFRDLCKTMGSLNEMMKLGSSQIELLVEVKSMYGASPLWLLLLLALYEKSHESHLIAEREIKFKRQREAIMINIEKYKVQELKWYDKCSQGTKIALGCGAGLLALCSILGLGALMWKSVSIFFPGKKEEITKESQDNFDVVQEEIELIPQVGAAGQSGDFRTKYQKVRKRVKIANKKNIAIKNSEFTTEDLHMETAQKINAIAQKCGAKKEVLQGAGLMQLSTAVVNEIFSELDRDIVKAVHKKFPASRNIIEKAIDRVYEDENCANCVYECSAGKVVVPKEVTNMIEIMGFDESNRARKGEQPKHFNPEDVRTNLSELIENQGFKGPTSHKTIIHKNLRDVRTEQLVRVVLRDANAQIFFPNTKKRAQVIRVFGDVIVFPIHYVDDFEEGKIFHIAMMNSVHKLTFESSKLIEFAAGQDLIAYRCGNKVPPARDIRQHFITIKDVMNFKPCEGFLSNTCCGMKGTTQYVDYTPQMNLITHENYPSGVYYEAGTLGNHNLTWALQYPIHSANGFCGSFISRISPTCERKVMGIHVAANGNFNYGYAELITQESLDLLYEDCVRSKLHPVKPCVDFEVLKMPIVANSEQDYNIEVEENKGFMPYDVNLKGVTFIGELPKDLVPNEVNTSSIEPSMFHGMFGEVKTEPSILHENDCRLVENEFHGNMQGVWHPGVDGVSKYGEEVKIFPDKDILLVESHLKDMFANAENSLNRRNVLSEEEMLNGIDDTIYWEGIEMSTAPGYPYALTREKGVKGKAYLFDERVDDKGRKKYSVKDPLLRERIDSRECCAKNNETFPTLALEKVKDERRKKKKIYQKPATRTFSCLPVDLNLLYRKYFLDFAVMQMENRDEFSCKVGINPDSLEWTRLFHSLKAQGGLAFAGDYGKFDGIGMPDIYMSITNVINAWYNDGNDHIRRVLVHELFHRYSLCGNRLFKIDQGMPSGFSMTVIFNSLMNYYFLAIAWLHLTKGMKFEIDKDISATPLEAFQNMTEIATYGDDNVVAIVDEVKEVYNLRTVSKFLSDYGITYTDDQKRPIEESEPYVHVEEVTFLKRGFLPMDKGRFIMRAPLDKVSITEQIQWVRKSPDPKAALLANCENALYEASIYGKEYFDKVYCKLNTLVALKKWVHPFESYENQLTRWWKNITMCDDFSHLHQLILEGKIVSGQSLSALSQIENFDEFKDECSYAGIPPLAFELDLGDEDLN